MAHFYQEGMKDTNYTLEDVVPNFTQVARESGHKIVRDSGELPEGVVDDYYTLELVAPAQGDKESVNVTVVFWRDYPLVQVDNISFENPDFDVQLKMMGKVLTEQIAVRAYQKKSLFRTRQMLEYMVGDKIVQIEATEDAELEVDSAKMLASS